MEYFILIICIIIVVILIKVINNAQPEINTSTTFKETQTYDTSFIEQDKNNDNLSLTDLAFLADFVAIDIKQANYSTCSACSVGLAFSDGKRIIGTRHYYIKPTPYQFDIEYAGKYGITEENVKNAPDFATFWHDDLLDIGACDIVCYNSQNICDLISDSYYASIKDIRYVLVSDYGFYDLSKIHNYIFPNVSEYNLNLISKKFNITYTDNDALSTAICVAKSTIEIIKKSGYVHIYTAGVFYHFVNDRCRYKNPHELRNKARESSFVHNTSVFRELLERTYNQKQNELRKEEVEKEALADKVKLDEGVLAESEGRIDDAIYIYSKLVDSDTKHFKAYKRLCILLRKTRRLEDELWATEKWLNYINDQPKKKANQIIDAQKRLTSIYAKLEKLNS